MNCLQSLKIKEEMQAKFQIFPEASFALRTDNAAFMSVPNHLKTQAFLEMSENYQDFEILQFSEHTEFIVKGA